MSIPHVVGRLLDGDRGASSRITYRHLALAREAIRELAPREAVAPASSLLELCLRLGAEALADPLRRRGDLRRSDLETRVAAMLDAVAIDPHSLGSRRVQYALASMHFAERALRSTPRSSGRALGHPRPDPPVDPVNERRAPGCGTYSTPDFIARAMVEDLFQALVANDTSSADVLDLSTEAGQFPLTIAVLRPPSVRVRFFAIDKDAEAVKMVDRLMAFAREGRSWSAYSIRTVSQDSLIQPLPRYWPKRFTAVVGNPPWARRPVPGLQVLRERRRNLLRGHDELYLAFLLRADELLRPGGYLSYLLPSGFLSNWNAEPFRRYLLDHYDILSLRIYPQRSFVELPALVPVSFVARKRGSGCLPPTGTRITYQVAGLGGPMRPKGSVSVPAAQLWKKLPGCVFHPLARPDCAFLLSGWPRARTLGQFGRLCLGLRLAKHERRSATRSFRGIRAADIRPFHACLRSARVYGPHRLPFFSQPIEPFIRREKVVFQELRYMTLEQRLVAAVAPSGTYPVSTASMFVPAVAGNVDFFMALMNSALINAWYKLRDIGHSIKLSHLRALPVPYDPAAWARIGALARKCRALRRILHEHLANCSPRSEDALVSRRYPVVHRGLQECRREIDALVFDLYKVRRAQQDVALRLATARVF